MNTLMLLAAIAVRNPFWPIGYDGQRQPITAEPIVEIRPTVNEGEDTATAVSEATVVVSEQELSTRNWVEARKTLRVEGRSTVTAPDGTKRHSVTINRLTYGDGDLISTNYDGRRYTWRIEGLTEGETLKLVRVRARDLED